jgi:hypothetical protein
MSLEDTKEKEEIFEDLADCKSEEDVYLKVNELFPGWLRAVYAKYSNDYPHLANNWKAICEKAETEPKRIILVSDIIFKQDHMILMRTCELLTKLGYCIRREGELVGCIKCNSALPTQPVWHLLQEKGLPVPRVWSNSCRGCQ